MLSLEKRKSNIELLRIISMLLIISNHYASHGVLKITDAVDRYVAWQNGGGINKIFTCFLTPGGQIGAALFFMITGYFCIDKETVLSIKKIIGEMIFYGMVCTVVAIAYSFFDDSYVIRGVVLDLVKSFFSPVTNEWWFPSTYLFLALLVPVINGYFQKNSQKNYLAILIFLWLIPYSLDSTFGSFFALVQKAIFFYLCGGYIRKYGNENIQRSQRRVLVIVTLFLWILGTVCMYMKASSIDGSAISSLMSLVILMFVTPVCSVSIFQIFASMRLAYNPIVNTIAGTVFGVYMFSDNELIRNILWNHLLDNIKFQYESPLYPLLAMLTIITVFTIFSIFDFCRRRYFENQYLKMLNNILKKVGFVIS